MRSLVDSSIWIRSFRGDAPTTRRLQELAASDSLAMCEPIAMELLSGAARQSVASLEKLVDSLPSLWLEPDLDFRAAAAMMRAVRATGHTVRSSVDGLIAAIAQRHDVVVVHDDVDYTRIAEVTRLRQERWSA